MTSEQTAWGRLQQKAPRRQYEHVKTWEKRNRRRVNFVRRLELTATGCWVWKGQSSLWRDRVYPVVSFRERGRKPVQRSAFAWLVHEFFPEFEPMTTHRTVPGCDVQLCINPWHRRDRRVTRQLITAAQAQAIYAARETTDAGEVAHANGISRDQVLSIWRGRNWTQVTGAPKHVPKRRVYTDAEVEKVRELRGTGSSREVATALGVHYKFVLAVWAGKRDLRNGQSV